MSTPNPLIMQRFKPQTAPARPVVADMEPDQSAKIVRPGLRDKVIESMHDGIVKAKHLQPGQKVRAYLHGEPRGGERVVKSVTPSEDGSMVSIEFSSPHPTTAYKAAYRFFDASLQGTTIQTIVQVPALVAYEEV